MDTEAAPMVLSKRILVKITTFPGPGGCKDKALLQEGWVIANHILVSFHVAFISSVLAIPDDATTRAEVLRFIFTSSATLVSALFTYVVFHSAIAFHELGHFLEAARLRALTDSRSVALGIVSTTLAEDAASLVGARIFRDSASAATWARARLDDGAGADAAGAGGLLVEDAGNIALHVG